SANSFNWSSSGIHAFNASTYSVRRLSQVIALDLLLKLTARRQLYCQTDGSRKTGRRKGSGDDGDLDRRRHNQSRDVEDDGAIANLELLSREPIYNNGIQAPSDRTARAHSARTTEHTAAWA